MAKSLEENNGLKHLLELGMIEATDFDCWLIVENPK